MIRELEELSMSAWPSLQTKLYDGWVLRFANGYTRRANSINPIYESTIDLDEKIDFCEKQYKNLNLPVTFKLTAESNPEGIDERLKERGYIKCNETSLRVLDITNYTYNKIEGTTVIYKYTDEWLAAFFNCSNIHDEKIQATARKILDNILETVVYAVKQIDNKIVGCGYGKIEGDYIGIFDIVVNEAYRGNGYAKDIINEILTKASKHNVKKAYLQVTSGNTPAEKLYDKLGFKEAYRYWYRIL